MSNVRDQRARVQRGAVAGPPADATLDVKGKQLSYQKAWALLALEYGSTALVATWLVHSLFETFEASIASQLFVVVMLVASVFSLIQVTRKLNDSRWPADRADLQQRSAMTAVVSAVLGASIAWLAISVLFGDPDQGDVALGVAIVAAAFTLWQVRPRRSN